MIHLKPNAKTPKGWFIGPWNSEISIPIGYANEGIQEKHYHSKMYEIYMVGRGTTTIIVNNTQINLHEGDMFVVEPGETHTFLDSSKDYFHFIIQTPFVKGDKFLKDQK